MKKLFIILISILASVSFVEAAGSLLAPQSNGLLTPQIINLASMVTGTLTTSNGGTGTTTPYGILYGDGSSTLKSTIIGTGLSFFNGVLTNTNISTTTSGVATTSALAITGLTGLMYANNGTKPISNPTNLTWDNTLYRLGIGTTTPYAKLSIWGSGNTTNQVFEAVDNASTTLMNILDNGNVNIGGSNLTYNGTTGVTAISSAYIGPQSFETDSGINQWINEPITSSSAVGTVFGYSAKMDGNDLLTFYGLSDGGGSVTNLGIGIGTTTPNSTLDVFGTFTLEGTSTVETSALGGSLLAAGGCTSLSTAVSSTLGLASTTAFITTPQKDPGDGFWWSTILMSPTSIKTRVCSSFAGTPVSTIYNVKIIK